MVERLVVVQVVAGSIPVPLPIFECGSGGMVDTLRLERSGESRAGSSPVSRTIIEEG